MSRSLDRLRHLCARFAPGIMLRTASLAWLITLGTVLLFVAAIVPGEKRTLLEYLHSKSIGVAVSLRDLTAGAAITDDYSSVVDHCVELVNGDPDIEFIVLTRNDGFSLIHHRRGWRSDKLGPEWRPQRRVAAAGIATPALFAQRVYLYSRPFEYSGIDWGWIHVGLSLHAFDTAVARMYWRIGLLAVACLLFAIAATMVYARHLVRPILRLQSLVRQVAGGHLEVRAPTDRTDELGQLAASINEMAEALLRRDRRLQEANETLERRVSERTRELQDEVAEKERTHAALAAAQQQLIELSREAGRAEIATGVLHNVGNVLNSVNVSATLVQEQLSRSQLQGLMRAVALLNEHRGGLADYLTHDEQGRYVPDYLQEVAAALATEHTAWAEELRTIAKNVEHIKEIVAMQQGYARVGGVIERLNPRELVDDALRVIQPSLTQNAIELSTRFEPTSDVMVDRHKVLLIVVNLLTNAKWAVESVPIGARIISVRIRNGGPWVEIAVADTGVGIAPENLPRMFEHGFTTRPNGHGFGLYTGALAARELGGQLRAQSPGPGRGATFTLQLPTTLESNP